METTTPFDLNQAIQRWRENFAQSPALRGENLAELESHLRDSVAALEARGLSGAEAFLVASRRMGNVALLETEFGKVNRSTVWLDRALWMLIGLQVWQLIVSPVGAISKSVVALGLTGGRFDFFRHGLTIPTILFAAVHLLTVAGCLVFCWWLFVRKGQSFASRIEPFLHGWIGLVLICGALCLILLTGSVVSYGSVVLQAKFMDPRTLGEITRSQTYSNMFWWITQTGGFILLTLILARRRLRIAKA
ncbi:MAG TPA: permease prefix domain 1-containing protein [Verrucomicrobiae bacterium]|nr:permease prefix domain 1-containing protein [Verrucomicrobiae bacterium]